MVYDFWKALGCTVKTLAPAEHDEIAARISHLPHVVAAAVINVVCSDGAHPLNFVGPGFKDFTRIASGPFEMWTEICLENREEIGRALDHLIDQAKAQGGSRVEIISGEERLLGLWHADDPG